MGTTIASSEPWWPPRRAAEGSSPNIVVIVLDDMGFSDVGCFGSEIPTPAIDSLAERGVRLSNFHVTPMCSPTRASLMTGLNHHEAGYGTTANGDPGFPNRRAAFPVDCLSLPAVLRDSGYATMAVGKWHLVPENEMHDAGVREMWPCQVGFDRYYGFLEGFTTQHHPHRLVRDNSAVTVDDFPEGYYLTDDLTDEAISMIRSTRANDPTRPFFLYFAHAAVHGPLQAKLAEIARHAERYHEGWDRIRERRFAKQIELGLFPPGTPLPGDEVQPSSIVDKWGDLPTGERALFARMMSVYAAMVVSVDQSVGRIVDTLNEIGELDKTVIVFLSDNGATAEGGRRGTVRYLSIFDHQQADLGLLETELDLLGGPRSLMHYPRGWAMACNTPFRLFKTTTHEGGVHSPFILSYPAGLIPTSAGTIRRQYQHVTDLFPTLVELAGLELPDTVAGRPRRDLAGHSFAPIFSVPDTETSHPEQYEEMLGNRSYYSGEWKAVTQHVRMTPFDNEKWELYDLRSDPAESNDLASTEPERMSELRCAWDRAARDFDVYPLDEGSGLSRALHDPSDERFVRSVTVYPGTPTLERQRATHLIAHRSFVIEICFGYEDGDEGVLLAHGGQGGGYAVYVEGRELYLAWNEFGELQTYNAGPLPNGIHVAALNVVTRQGGRCDATLTGPAGSAAVIDGIGFAGVGPLEGIDVGIDRGSPVSWPLYERHRSFPYSGVLERVTYQPGDLAPDAPEKRIEAMRAAGLRFQ